MSLRQRVGFRGTVLFSPALFAQDDKFLDVVRVEAALRNNPP